MMDSSAIKEELKGYDFNGFFLNVVEKKLSYENTPLKLEAWDFEVLLCLVEKCPNLAKNEDIKNIFPRSRSINKAKQDTEKSISRLRRHFNFIKENYKDNKVGLNHVAIGTIKSEGYCLYANVVRVYENLSRELPEASTKPQIEESTDLIEPQDENLSSPNEEKVIPIDPDKLSDDTVKNQSADNEISDGQIRIGKWFNSFKKQFWNNEFNSWLFNKNNFLAIGTFGLVALAIVIIVSFLIIENSTPEQENKLKWVVSLIQGVIILFALTYSIKSIKEFNPNYKTKEGFDSLNEKTKNSLGYHTFDKWRSASRIAENVCKYFIEHWKSILVIWFILYLFLTIIGLIAPDITDELSFNSPAHRSEITLHILITAINYTSSLAFFLCFNILNSPTNFGKEDETIERNTLGIGIIFIVLIILLEGAILYCRTPIPKEIWKYFDVVSGITAGVCMALLFGRLQSKFLNPPSWLIVIFFIYSSIQALFHYLKEDPQATSLMLLALVFKSLLFLYMNFLFESGRLLFYLIKVRNTYENVEDEFIEVSSLFYKKK